MQNEILQTVIEITGQRDLDSMDYSFVATLGELVPVTDISLLKLSDVERLESLEQVVHLDVDAGKGVEAHYHWADEQKSVTLDPLLLRCLNEGKPVPTEADNEKPGRLLMPIIVNTKIIGVLELGSNECLLEHSNLIEGLVKIYSNYNVILNESERDNLTGLLNRRTFDNKLTRMLKELRNREVDGDVPTVDQRQPHPDCNAWLAIVDIDHFKRVNDLYGHVYGDEILLLFAQKMRQMFRRSDLLFRVGGEEFVVILAPETAQQAKHILDRFREAIENHHFPQVDRITVSVGYERIKEGDYPRQVFDLADKALYYAKENGRNCVHHYEALVAAGDLIDEDKSGSIELF
jgi:diguanylate cyclase (GGDEF)-like protein